MKDRIPQAIAEAFHPRKIHVIATCRCQTGPRFAKLPAHGWQART